MLEIDGFSAFSLRLSSTDSKISFAVPVSLAQQNAASAANTIHIKTALF